MRCYLVFKSFSDACSKISRIHSALSFFSLLFLPSFFFLFPFLLLCLSLVEARYQKPGNQSSSFTFFPCLSSSPTYLFFSFPLIFHVILTSFIFSPPTTFFSQTDILLKILSVLHWHFVLKPNLLSQLCTRMNI